jgi:ABC-2 type transport system permease protein
MLGALGVISSGVKKLENFAGVMNFVIFPMFFASSALYPLWRVQEGSPALPRPACSTRLRRRTDTLRAVRTDELDLAGGRRRLHDCGMVGAIYAYDPSRGLTRRDPAGGET